MGHFSNGSEADQYERKYCEGCVHWEGCPVFWMHIDPDFKNSRDALEEIIPTEGIENLKCKMHYPEGDK